MSRAAQQVWTAVVAAKERAKARLEQELVAARRHHETLRATLDEANAAVRHARARHLAHEERIARMLADPRGLSPSVYLDHDLYRAPLAQEAEEAGANLRRASDAVDAQQRVVERLGLGVRRADAALDAAREQLRKTFAAARRREQERTDEEAAETAAARMRSTRRGDSHA